MILSAGIIPLRKTEGQWELLLLRCFKYWDFPKGECHPNEAPLQAALREFEEETSLHDIQMKWNELFYETAPYAKGKIARYYLGEVQTNEDVKLTPNPETGVIEHHEYRWVSFEEALKLTGPRINKVIEWAKAQSSFAN